ncbi:MAG: DNA polymerase I [Proteobacteria bacterium]|nr:DNA polymerase I [Pseudomonadota bacterium]MBU1737184.1 DNA polymerase I [Pseudomonadota bacterium]
MTEKVYLIDGSAYIYRAYHAVAPLTNSSGLPTHAVYGFVNILLRVIREKSAKYLAVAFDMKGPTFRHEMYGEYKANRPPMPEDLACQIPYVRDIVGAYNITCLERAGFEADDLIASAARALEKKGLEVVVVSGDKDLLQLVSERITVWEPMQDRVMGPQEVAAKYGIPVAGLLDYFSLVGDSSDNIPGVPGVGPKTAATLIGEYGTLESLYEKIAEVDKKKLAEKLAANREEAFLSRDLIRLKEDLEIPDRAEGYLIPEPDNDKLRELFTFLGFTRLLKSQVENPNLDPKGYRLVGDAGELKKICKKLGAAQALVVDTETTSLDTLTAELVGISLCADEKEAFYVPTGHRREDGSRCPGQLTIEEALGILRPLLEDLRLPKICHNLKFDYGVLATHGVTMKGPLYDTMIASYLLDPSRRSHKLDDLCGEILQVRMTPFSEVVGGDKKGSKKKDEANFALVDIAVARDYSCEDVHGTYLLWEHFRPQLEALDLWDLFAEVEMALVPILSGMERTGILVSQQELETLTGEFGATLADMEREIYRLAGEEFNINSPKQLGEILFEKLNLPHDRKTKTGYSTDANVLEKLANYHDLPAAVINYRNLAKLKSTYADRLLELVHPKTGRVHTSFNQTVTTTGRLSSSDPNLQNIPIRTPEGQRIRQTFIPEKGDLLLGADYSQIELRVLAHYSGDHALADAFLSGRDIHAETAAEVFRVSPAFITPQMRRVAKTINFGIVYGISAFGLSSQLHISRKEAATFIERYFAHYAGVKKYMEEIVERARQDGYVETLLKRRRPLPDIGSANKNTREFAERTAINTPIQGTAADIIKLATIAVDRRLKAENLPARLLLQIHDELVFEVAENKVEKVSALVKEEMESVMKLAVPLVVNVACGKNLAET